MVGNGRTQGEEQKNQQAVCPKSYEVLVDRGGMRYRFFRSIGDDDGKEVTASDLAIKSNGDCVRSQIQIGFGFKPV